jgi:RNA polymerase sigma factor (sigma-70 family)
MRRKVELHEIIDRVREGDNQEFARLVSRYRDMAFGYALTLLEQEQMAEDVVQEAFVVAYTHLGRLQQTRAFGAWLRGIVRHQCYREMRNAHRVLSWEHLEEMVSKDADPAQNAVNRAASEQVQGAISELPTQQQEVVRLHYEMGWSQKEIATRLDLTLGAVNMRLHAARTRLRRRLLMRNEQTVHPYGPGRVQTADGPVVTLQFAPNAVPPLFSLLHTDSKDSLCVIQHLSTGRVRAVATRTEAIWTPGQEILATGQPFTEPLALSTIQQTVNAFHAKGSDARQQTSDTRLESGIKTIEVFAPLTQGGCTGIFTEWGLGVLVLLPELMHHLDCDGNRQVFFVLVPPIRDAVQWQEVIGEITIGNRTIEIVYLPVADPLAREFAEGLQNLDTTLVLARRLAEQAIWPCLDPLACHSRRLDTIEAEPGHANMVTAVRQLLRHYYTLQFSLGEEACRTLSARELQEVQRARKVLRFLSQPFFMAEPYTGKPGRFVTSDEALRGFGGIAAGRYDTVPQDALYMVGAAPQGE